MQRRELRLHRVDQRIVQRRDLAVFLGAQALEPGLARVDRHPPDARALQHVQKFGQHLFGLLVVHPDAALDGHGHGAGVLHGRHAIGDHLRRGHQDRTKGAGLHAVAWTAAVQVDLVITPGGGQPRGLGQFRRVRSAQLQRHRVFGGVVIQQARPVAVDDRRRGDHLGVQQRTARHQPVEPPTVAVGPVHHRRDRKARGITDRVGHGRSGIAGQGRRYRRPRRKAQTGKGNGG